MGTFESFDFCGLGRALAWTRDKCVGHPSGNLALGPGGGLQRTSTVCTPRCLRPALACDLIGH